MSQTDEYTVDVSPKVKPTNLTIDVPSEGPVGQQITIRGRLTSDGTGVSNKTIEIWEALTRGSEKLTETTTGGDGYYGTHYVWNTIGNKTVYAYFPGTAGYEDDYSSRETVEIK